MKHRISLYTVFAGLLTLASQAEKALNPVIWADVPDVAVIRVDDPTT